MRNLTLAVLMTFAFAATQASASSLHLKTLRSHHYEIHTNLSRNAVEPFAAHMDAVFNDYSQKFSNFNNNSNAPKLMNLYLLATRNDYINFMAKHNIGAKNSGGMFFIQPRISGLATWVLNRPRQLTFSVLQHEGFHQFAFNHIGANLPIWINEGLAQYYQDGIMINYRLQLGTINIHRLKLIKTAIKNKRIMPLSKLVGLSAKSWHKILHNKPQISTILYAQSWSMAYFITYANDGMYKQAFLQYLHLVANGMNGKTAFAQAFKTNNFSAVENQWINYVKKQKPDSLSIALYKLKFLGQAMQYLITKRRQTPHSISDLRHQLRGFYTIRRIEGLKIKQRATNKMYRYKKPNGSHATFKMVQSKQAGLPPIITAPGLTPQPILRWKRNQRGALQQYIEFE